MTSRISYTNHNQVVQVRLDEKLLPEVRLDVGVLRAAKKAKQLSPIMFEAVQKRIWQTLLDEPKLNSLERQEIFAYLKQEIAQVAA